MLYSLNAFTQVKWKAFGALTSGQQGRLSNAVLGDVSVAQFAQKVLFVCVLERRAGEIVFFRLH
jgi:hypothetical protein